MYSKAEATHEELLWNPFPKDNQLILNTTEAEPQPIKCVCGSELFETNALLSAMEGHTIWSHVDDNGCDDPTPIKR